MAHIIIEMNFTVIHMMFVQCIRFQTIEAIKPREWYKQQAERSDFIRLSEGSHLIRMLVYLSERE